jgi:hypothetical protein
MDNRIQITDNSAERGEYDRVSDSSNSSNSEHFLDYHVNYCNRCNLRKLCCACCRSACDSRITKRTSNISSIITLLILLSATTLGIAIYISEYSNVQKIKSFVSQIENIDISDIETDINVVTDSIGQLRDILNAARQIKNKTVFVRKIVRLVDIACRMTNCNK